MRRVVYVLLAGLFVLIVVPSLMRARVSPGSPALPGDARSVQSGEAAYAQENGGYFDRLDCLVTPKACIPGYPDAGPSFLVPQLGSLKTQSGYVREFHEGPKAPAEALRDGRLSRTSLQSYAYVAVPVPRSGWTSFWEAARSAWCVDSTGLICSTPDGSAPQVRDGRCVVGRCRPLR